MNKLTFMLTVCFLSLICPIVASADIPMMINYQGYVEDSGGSPIDGNAFVKFAIVNEAGNSTYWSNDGTGVNGNEPDNAVALTTNNGIFSIKLGDSDLANMNSLPTDSFENQDIYVRVWFSENNITFEQLSPDTQIVSAGFAYKAQSVVESISWTQIPDIPAGFDDGTDDGIASETDPTITDDSIKDGVDWTELSGIPADIADGDDEGSGGAETDPVFIASPAAGISGTNISNWNTAYSWGNHSSQGYLTEVYSLRGYNGGTENALFAANDGKIGIGITSPSEKLHVNGNARFNLGGGSMTLTTPGGWPGVIAYAPNGDRRDIQYYNNGMAITVDDTSSAPSAVEGIFIHESARVGIGTTTPNYRLHINGTTYCNAGVWTGSDKRWKKNIEPLENVLDKMNSLQGVRYEWKTDEFPDQGFTNEAQIGLVAQDVERVMPELVHTDQKGFKAVSYDKLSAVLIEAVKEQQVTIEALSEQLNKMEKIKQAEIESLKDQLTHLRSMVETFIAQQSETTGNKSLLTFSRAQGKDTLETPLAN